MRADVAATRVNRISTVFVLDPAAQVRAHGIVPFNTEDAEISEVAGYLFLNRRERGKRPRVVPGLCLFDSIIDRYRRFVVADRSWSDLVYDCCWSSRW
jgi:hypothetical protein